jgi:hypothetical protein
LLNIICRKVMLSDHAQYSPGGENCTSVNWVMEQSSSEQQKRATRKARGFHFCCSFESTIIFSKGHLCRKHVVSCCLPKWILGCLWTMEKCIISLILSVQ